MMPKSGQMTLPPKFFSMIYGKLLALHLSAYRTTPYTIYRMNHRKFTILSVTRVVNRNRQSFFFASWAHMSHTLKCLLYLSVCMPVRQYMLCTTKLALPTVRIIGTLEYKDWKTTLESHYSFILKYSKITV